MSNYPNRPFFYSLLSAFRPYAAQKTASSSVTTTTSAATSHAFSSNSQIASSSSSTSTHAQITQNATARAIASKSSSTGQTQGFAQAAAAFSPPSHHHTKHTTTSSSPGRRAPSTQYGSQGFGGGRARRGSDSSGDEGFVQRPGAEKWFVGGKVANGEERFYKLSMVRRERSNDRKSCDRMSL